jgi:hypothetical protein
MTRYTLTAADLFVIITTLSESTAIADYFSTPKETRKIVMDKVEDMLHGMTTTVEVNNDEEDQ